MKKKSVRTASDMVHLSPLPDTLPVAPRPLTARSPSETASARNFFAGLRKFLSEKVTFRIMKRIQMKAPLKAPGTISPWYLKGCRESLNWAPLVPRGVSLSDGCTQNLQVCRNVPALRHLGLAAELLTEKCSTFYSYKECICNLCFPIDFIAKKHVVGEGSKTVGKL